MTPETAAPNCVKAARGEKIGARETALAGRNEQGPPHYALGRRIRCRRASRLPESQRVRQRHVAVLHYRLGSIERNIAAARLTSRKRDHGREGHDMRLARRYTRLQFTGASPSRRRCLQRPSERATQLDRIERAHHDFVLTPSTPKAEAPARMGAGITPRRPLGREARRAKGLAPCFGTRRRVAPAHETAPPRDGEG